MALTTYEVVTSTSADSVTALVKATIATKPPIGSVRADLETVGGKVQFFQVIASGATAATDYKIVQHSDRATFTALAAAAVVGGFAPLGDLDVLHTTVGGAHLFVQAFSKP